MKSFKDGAPLRLALPWEPPVQYEDPRMWAVTLADNLDCAGVRDLIGHFDQYEITGNEIHFFMHPTRRRAEIDRLVRRRDKSWLNVLEVHPEAKLCWAEDLYA